jgi:SPP1 gp7 family putative phage head morphogenesis protein
MSKASEQRKFAKQRFNHARRLEIEYLRRLRQVVNQVDSITKGMAPGGKVFDVNGLQQMLNKYAELITPWARSVGARMLAQVAQRDETAWVRLGKDVGKALREEIQAAPTGTMLREMLNEQVKLITSLPVEAGQRVHKLVLEGMVDSTRASEIAKEIMKTGEVTMSRAKLIARTEVARVAAGLTQARAEHVGVTHYVWRTSGDSDVRESHKKMNNKVIAYAEPPTLSDGTVTHAGAIYNCRCYADPILPED